MLVLHDETNHHARHVNHFRESHGWKVIKDIDLSCQGSTNMIWIICLDLDFLLGLDMGGACKDRTE